MTCPDWSGSLFPVPPHASQEFDDLFDYARAVARRWRLILGGTAVLVAAAIALTLVASRQYRTSALLVVSESKIWSSRAEMADVTLPQYLEIARSGSVLQKAMAKMGPALTACGAPRVEVLPVDASRLLRVFATCADAAAAAQLANGVAAEAVALSVALNEEATVRAVRRLQQQVSDADARLRAAEDALRASPPASGLDDRMPGEAGRERWPRRVSPAIGEELASRRMLLEYRLAEDSYAALTRRLAEVRLLAQVKDAELKLLDSAPVPGALGPRLLLNVTLAAVAGAILFTVLALVLEFARPRRLRLGAEPGA